MGLRCVGTRIILLGSSGVIRAFHLLRSFSRPGQADAVLIIDSYAVLPTTITGKLLKPVAWWNDLFYDPTTGNVTLDASEAAGGVITSFLLENAPGGDGFITRFAGLPFVSQPVIAPEQIATADPLQTGFGGTHELGRIFPPGLDAAGLASFLTRMVYIGQAGTGEVAFDLIVTVSPVASNDAASTTPGNSIVIDVLANDQDADGALVPGSVRIESRPLFGRATVDPNTGQITYTPGSAFAATDHFVYSVADGDGSRSTATVAIGPISVTFNGRVIPDDMGVIDLGLITIVDKVPQIFANFVITNLDVAPVSIEHIDLPPGFEVVRLGPRTLASGASRNLLVHGTLTDFGFFEGRIAIQVQRGIDATDDAEILGGTNVEFDFIAVGQAARLVVSVDGSDIANGQPTPVDFGTVVLGTPGTTRDVLIRNVGAAPSYEFTMPSVPAGFSIDNPAPVELVVEPFSDEILTVRLNGDVSGSKSGQFRMSVSSIPFPPATFMFPIVGSVATPGDLNCDGATNNLDITPFIHALTVGGDVNDPAKQMALLAWVPGGCFAAADLDLDGSVTNTDITPFVEVLSGVSGQAAATSSDLSRLQLEMRVYLQSMSMPRLAPWEDRLTRDTPYATVEIQGT